MLFCVCSTCIIQKNKSKNNRVCILNLDANSRVYKKKTNCFCLTENKKLTRKTINLKKKMQEYLPFTLILFLAFPLVPF